MTVFHEIYKEMLEANKKAKTASVEYNRRDKEIEDLETVRCKELNLDPETFKTRLNGLKDSDQSLTGCFNRYKFWAGEVQRLSSLLTGALAYIQLKNHMPPQ